MYKNFVYVSNLFSSRCVGNTNCITILIKSNTQHNNKLTWNFSNNFYLQVEEQPRKIEHIIKALNACLNGGELTKERYSEQAQDLVFNENILLQTLGFDVAIDHPHTHVVKTMQLVNGNCGDYNIIWVILVAIWIYISLFLVTLNWRQASLVKFGLYSPKFQEHSVIF